MKLLFMYIKTAFIYTSISILKVGFQCVKECLTGFRERVSGISRFVYLNGIEALHLQCISKLGLCYPTSIVYV